LFDANCQVYGVRKIWRRLRRDGFDVARYMVARLMKRMGIQAIIRGRPQKTTVPDKKVPSPMDKVNRQFRVSAPNMLWVSDFTYVATWKGFDYVAPRYGHSDRWRPLARPALTHRKHPARRSHDCVTNVNQPTANPARFKSPR
jgi:transposase InsO family protein